MVLLLSPAFATAKKDSLYKAMQEQEGIMQLKTKIQYIRELIPKELDSARMLLNQNPEVASHEDLLLRADYNNTWGLY